MSIEKRRVLFIDSALEDEIKKALDLGYQGVTTNPSLVAKAPSDNSSQDFMEKYLNYMTKLVELCQDYELDNGEKPSLSVEVFSLEPKEMIEQAEIIRDNLKYDELAVKIPISYKEQDYLNVINELADKGFNINATCGFSESQLELSAQAGARFISLFYNRLIDYFNNLPNSKGDGQEKSLEILRKTRNYLDNNNFNCEIILGSIRKPYDVTLGWENGADIVTAGYKVVPGMVFHLGTDSSVAGFDKDLKEWLSRK